MRQRPVRRRVSEGGFSLLEVVMALAIICIALFAVVTMILQTSSSNESLRETELAREGATAKLEEIKAHAADPNAFTAGSLQNLASLYNGTSFAVTGLSDPTNPPALLPGTVTVDSTNSNIFDVRVTIKWKGRQGSRIYQIGSLYTR